MLVWFINSIFSTIIMNYYSLGNDFFLKFFISCETQRIRSIQTPYTISKNYAYSKSVFFKFFAIAMAKKPKFVVLSRHHGKDK